MVSNSTNREKQNKADVMYFLMEVHTKTYQIFLSEKPKTRSTFYTKI